MILRAGCPLSRAQARGGYGRGPAVVKNLEEEHMIAVALSTALIAAARGLHRRGEA